MAEPAEDGGKDLVEKAKEEEEPTKEGPEGHGGGGSVQKVDGDSSQVARGAINEKAHDAEASRSSNAAGVTEGSQERTGAQATEEVEGAGTAGEAGEETTAVETAGSTEPAGCESTEAGADGAEGGEPAEGTGVPDRTEGADIVEELPEEAEATEPVCVEMHHRKEEPPAPIETLTEEPAAKTESVEGDEPADGGEDVVPYGDDGAPAADQDAAVVEEDTSGEGGGGGPPGHDDADGDDPMDGDDDVKARADGGGGGGGGIKSDLGGGDGDLDSSGAGGGAGAGGDSDLGKSKRPPGRPKGAKDSRPRTRRRKAEISAIRNATAAGMPVGMGMGFHPHQGFGHPHAHLGHEMQLHGMHGIDMASYGRTSFQGLRGMWGGAADTGGAGGVGDVHGGGGQMSYTRAMAGDPGGRGGVPQTDPSLWMRSGGGGGSGVAHGFGDPSAHMYGGVVDPYGFAGRAGGAGAGASMYGDGHYDGRYGAQTYGMSPSMMMSGAGGAAMGMKQAAGGPGRTSYGAASQRPGDDASSDPSHDPQGVGMWKPGGGN